MLENDLAESISLNGIWEIEIAGQKGEIRVPGAWEAQGYSGKAGMNDPVIYRRSFDVPKEWEDADIWLQFGAISYYAEVFVNGVSVGTHEGLWTAFEFDVTHAVHVGETNQLEIRVIKPGYKGDRFPYRDVLVGFLPYVFDTFGGIWQDVTLSAQWAASFYALQATADFETGKVAIYSRIAAKESSTKVFTVLDDRREIVVQERQFGRQSNECELEVKDRVAWSPDSPSLYTLMLELEDQGQIISRRTQQFGFRQLIANGDQVRFNSEPIHLRGILSWGWNPRTLAPMPTDDEVRDEFRRVRELGFNMVKLCLFVPPENVFRIADEEGMLLWLELPLWLPNLTEHLRKQARIEYHAIMKRVQHHPSIVIYSLGCELGADMADAALLDALNSTVRNASRGALVCDNSGSGEAYAGLTFDYADFNDYHFYADLQYFNPLLDLFHRDWRPPRPLIFGEFCDADDYRDPADLLEDGQRPAWRDYFGIEGNLNRWAYSEQEQRIAANKLPFSDAQIRDISRKQSFVVRKTILERTRLRCDIGGYVLTGLRDTPISTSGVFDDAGRSKYDVKAFTQFNSDTVLLLEQGRSRRWTFGGDRPYPADLFNHRSGEWASFRAVLAYAQRNYEAGELAWRLIAPNGAVQDGAISIGRTIATSPSEIARLELQLSTVECAEQWTLEVELDGSVSNHWPLWIYPTLPPLDVAVYDPAGTLSELRNLPRADLAQVPRVIIAGAFTRELEQFLEAGGRAVVIQNGAGALPTQAVPFWRESIKLLCEHPLMNNFPHQGFADLQFYHLATDHAFDTALFANKVVTPVIRRLDARLFTMLDYLIDVQIGKGRMIATTLRLFGGAGDQVWGLEANVAGEYLLKQMVQML